jgi:predicted aspartyl protease
MPFFASLRYVCAMLPAAMAALSLTAQETVHSAPIEVTHGKPFVMATVNGQGPFRFVIDTGTGGDAIVTGELADRLGLPAAGQVKLNDPSGLGEKVVPAVLIRSLQIDGIMFTGVKAVRHNLSDQDGPCQGVLGFALFRDFLFTLDYPNRQITLASGSLAADGGRSVLPFAMPFGVPIVVLSVGDLRFDALIDSGGEGLSLPENLASRMKFAVDPVAFANGQSLSTRFQLKAARMAADVRLGEYIFEHSFVEINPAFPLANLGSCPMRNFALTFDQKNLLVRLRASRKRFTLSATPTAIRLVNAPLPKPLDPNLVPVG